MEEFELDGDDVRICTAGLMEQCHGLAKSCGWWTDMHTGESLAGKRNVGELLMLTVSELAEAMEAHRTGLMDDKLPHRSMLEVELADAIIRICDMAAALELDLPGAMAEKLFYNLSRQDHKPENRKADGGKKY